MSETEGFCDFTTSAVTFSHETGVRGSKADVFFAIWLVRRQPFARNEVRVSKTEGFFRFTSSAATFARNPVRVSKPVVFFASLVGPAATILHETRLERQTNSFFCKIGWSSGNAFALFVKAFVCRSVCV